MATDLAELHQRLDWCHQAGRALEAKIVTAAGQSIQHWLVPWQPGAGEIKAKMLSPPPVKLRIEIGLIVNEQRAILDALACILATRNGANHIKDVYFPVTRDKAAFADGRKKIRKLSQADRDAIESLTPWAPDDDGVGNLPLFLLHEADRVRKHQKLLQWACVGGVGAASNGVIGSMVSEPVVFEEVGREETLASFSNVTCQLAVHIDLIYVEPAALNGNPVANCLREFYQAVAEVVARFD